MKPLSTKRGLSRYRLTQPTENHHCPGEPVKTGGTAASPSGDRKQISEQDEEDGE